MDQDPVGTKKRSFLQHFLNLCDNRLRQRLRKLGETDKAEKALRRLTKNTQETRAFIRDVLADNLDKKQDAIRQSGGYSPFTEEELIMAVTENEYAYSSTPLFSIGFQRL